MGIFKKREAEDSNKKTIECDLLEALIKGDTITRELALTIPAVNSAVDLISSLISILPIYLYKKTNEQIEKINDNRCNILNLETGDTLDGVQLKKALVEDYLLGAGGYAFIEKNKNTVTGLFYVKDTDVSIIGNVNPIFKSYSIYVLGERYDAFQFVKILRNTKNGSTSKSVIEQISNVLEVSYQTLLYQLKLIKGGGKKRGFLQSDHVLEKEALEALKTAWNRMYQSPDNTLVLSKGIEFKEATSSALDMQLNENQVQIKKEINEIFHICEKFEDTFKFAINPIIKAFEAAINRTLLTEEEKRNNYYFKFDTNEITKEPTLERYKAYVLAKQAGMKTGNEMRREEEMNDIPGLDVINLSLGSVLYNTKNKEYFTPNTNEINKLGEDSRKEKVDEN